MSIKDYTYAHHLTFAKVPNLILQKEIFIYYKVYKTTQNIYKISFYTEIRYLIFPRKWICL
jgi:hypothetical protein